jgi:hypothetical protein
MGLEGLRKPVKNLVMRVSVLDGIREAESKELEYDNVLPGQG